MAVSLIATLSGADSNSLLSVDDANDYHDVQLSSGQWDALDPDTKARALISATRQLEELEYWGDKANPSQALAWPRYYLGVSDGQNTPPEILAACCEHALSLAIAAPKAQAGLSRRQRLRAEGVISMRLGDASESYAPLSQEFSTSGSLSQFSGRVQRLLSRWVRSAWPTDSGRRPTTGATATGSYDSNGRWWPTELGG